MFFTLSDGRNVPETGASSAADSAAVTAVYFIMDIVRKGKGQTQECATSLPV